MSFGRLHQRIVLKCVPHVQHDYFSSFNQSDHCFLDSSLLKLPIYVSFNISKNYYILDCEEAVSHFRPGGSPREASAENSRSSRVACPQGLACACMLLARLSFAEIGGYSHNKRKTNFDGNIYKKWKENKYNHHSILLFLLKRQIKTRL